MSKKRTILIGVLGLLIGLCIGSLGAVAVLGRNAADAMRIVSLENRADLETRVHQAYYDEDYRVGIWALENLIGFLNQQAELFPDEGSIWREIVLDHARLSVLYRRAGRETDAKNAMNEAIRRAKETRYHLDSEEELTAFLDRQLRVHRSESRK